MGILCSKKYHPDPDSAWKQQNREFCVNPIYQLVDFQKGGELIDAYRRGGRDGVIAKTREKIEPILYCGEHYSHEITLEDYLSWKKACLLKMMDADECVLNLKTEVELPSAYTEDKFNKFKVHEACWSLQHRGPMGETALHICYLMNTPEHSKVAEILLELYPKLALDVYEGEEYYGESALHLAVVYRDLHSVKLLISYNANVNQRATGRFFLPEDQKGNFSRETSYEGYAYFGEYPLAFAASFGHFEIYDYLIDHGANPDLQDSFGNTVLHMVVINDQVEMYKHAAKHHKSRANPNVKNFANLTPLTLASKLGRHKIFELMLELGSTELWRYSNITCSTYPLSALDTIGPDGRTNWNSALMMMINGQTEDHLEMVEGKVIKQLLDEKWKTFAKTGFLRTLFMAVLHLILISISVYTRPIGDLLVYAGPIDAIRFFAEVCVCVACIGILVSACMELWSQGFLGFIKNSSYAPAKTLFLLSCILIVLCIPLRFARLHQEEDALLIIAVPGCWFVLLFFARGVRLTGPFVTMIYKMLIGDLCRFGIIYIILMCSFTQAFYFLFRDVKNKTNFLTIPGTVMTLFQMTLGEFSYSDFDATRHPLVTKLVFAVFMILVPILLLNMLIAMMGNTYQQVISKSDKEWKKQWAKTVVVLENSYSSKKLLKFQKEYSIPLKGDDGSGIKNDQRGLMVIKTSSITKAKQRKGALSNWKRTGKEVMNQVRCQKQLGNCGPIRLMESQRNSVHLGPSGDEFLAPVEKSDSDNFMQNFTETISQVAWGHDINLTKLKDIGKKQEVINSPKKFSASGKDANQSSVTSSPLDSIRQNRIHPMNAKDET